MKRYMIRKDRAYSEFKMRKYQKEKEYYSEGYSDSQPIWPIWWERE